MNDNDLELISFHSKDGKSQTVKDWLKDKKKKEDDALKSKQITEVEDKERKRSNKTGRVILKFRPYTEPSGQPLIFDRYGINRKFWRRLMAESKTRTVELIASSLIDGSQLTAKQVLARIQEVEPETKLNAQSVSWNLVRLFNSPAGNLIERTGTKGTGYKYRLASCVISNLTPNQVYRLYLKMDKKVTLDSLSDQYPEIRAHLMVREEQDKSALETKKPEPEAMIDITDEEKSNPVDEDLPVEHDTTSFASEILETVANKSKLDINVNVTFRFVFGEKR